jgi:hypothetical protein
MRADPHAGLEHRLHLEADVIVPPRSTAVLSEYGRNTPTQRDQHLHSIAEHGRMAWRKRSGYNRRAFVETAISRFKRVIGDALRSRADRRRATEISMAVHAPNRRLELGRPKSVRVACHQPSTGEMYASADPCNTAYRNPMLQEHTPGLSRVPPQAKSCS